MGEDEKILANIMTAHDNGFPVGDINMEKKVSLCVTSS